MADRSFSSAVEEALGVIERALDNIRTGKGVESELHTVRACLLEVLDLVERDPGIEAASDDLYSVARNVACGPDRGRRMSRLLHEAFLRFRDPLDTAQPSGRWH